MPFLSTSQLIVVLWLLAAAAPAASVLLNGSFLVVTTAALESSRPEAERAVIRARRTVSRQAPARPLPIRTEGSSFGEDRSVASLPASILHTALQRHRPRVA